MLRKALLAATFGVILGAGVSNADVVIRVAPPVAVVERPIARPGATYVWAPGYHRWDGSRYVWVGGSWLLPPRPHAAYVPAHWAHRHGGYVFV